MTAVRAAFLDGLRQPRLSTALGILLVAAVEIAALCAWVTPDRLADLAPGLLMRQSDDDGAAISIRALQLRRDANPQARPVVVVTGASSLREALLSEDTLRADLAAALGPEGAAPDAFRLYDLATSGQFLFESLALLRAVPRDTPGVLVLGVGPLRLLLSPADVQDRVRHPNLALPRELLDPPAAALGAEIPWSTGNFFLDQAQFFVSRPQVPVRALLGPTTLRRHRYLGREPWSDARLAETVAELRARAEGGVEVAERSLALLAGELPALVAGGCRTVVLLEAPKSPRAAAALADLDAAWRGRTAEIGRAAGALIWNLDAEAGLTEADFHDYTHLGRREAMERYQRALAARLAPLLRARTTDPRPPEARRCPM